MAEETTYGGKELIPLELFRDEITTLTFSALDDSDVAVDLTGATITGTIRKRDESGVVHSYSSGSGFTISAADGEWTWTLNATGLLGNYVWSHEVVIGASEVDVISGTLTVKNHPTH